MILSKFNNNNKNSSRKFLYFYRHENVICRRKCGEQLPCGHSCQKFCHYKTSNQHSTCNSFVEKIIPECGHKTYTECSKIVTSKNCRKTTLKQLACGHSVDVPCRIISSVEELKQVSCSEPCGKILACKHQCSGKCGDCHAGQLHIACKEKCERDLICSHVSLLN
jgi:hypothetical protein